MSDPFIVAITGATGSIYAVRLIEELVSQGQRVDLVISPLGARCLKEECGMTARSLAGERVRVHPIADLGADLSTGTYRTAGMIIIPATTGTCGRIAAGTSDNLIVRAADVTLKESRKLVVVVRESPLNLIHLRALTTLAEAGAIVMPACPGFYHNPTSIDDLVDFLVARVLAQFGFEPSDSVKYRAPGQEGPVVA